MVQLRRRTSDGHQISHSSSNGQALPTGRRCFNQDWKDRVILRQDPETEGEDDQDDGEGEGEEEGCTLV